MKTILAALIISVAMIAAAQILTSDPTPKEEKTQTGMEQTCVSTAGNKISYYACN